MHISIAAEKLFDLGPLPITNSLIATWLTIIIFIILIVIIRIKKNIIPIGIQNVIEYILEFFYQTICDAVEDEKRGQRFFPLVMTIFLFVLLINWLGLLPGFGSIGFYHGHGEHKEFVPYLRGASADLNTTLALALISVFLTQVYSIKYLGFKGFIGRFIKLRSPIYFFVGILELISEFAKIISFSFRLFG
ncbi:MAG: FoF1 ATP synthase subunit a, partial [candidate division WOR-3 bacterium]